MKHRTPSFLSGGGEMGAMLRSLDWQQTALGDPADWPISLQTAVSLMLGSAQPVYIAWGPDLVSLYNDGYVPILGTKHPAVLAPYRQLWSEIWDQFKPVVAAIRAGEAQHFVDLPMALAGRANTPMSYFTFSWTPLRDRDEIVQGFYCAATETTRRVLAERDRDRALARLHYNEERMRALLEASADSVYSMSPDWTEMRQLDGRGFIPDTDTPSIRWEEEYLLSEDRSFIRSAIERAMASGVAFDLEHRVRRTDGTVGWTASRAVPIQDQAGNVVEWFGMAADVSARHNAEAALRESEAFMASVLASSTDCIKVLDLDGRLTFMSEGGQKVMEVSDFNVIEGCPWQDFWQGAGKLEVAEAVEKARQGGSSSFVGEATTMGGTSKWWHVAVSPIAGPDGNPARILSVSRDITDQKRAELDLHVMNGELAHRLKNVLAVVQSVAQQTLRQAPDLETASRDLSSRLVALGRATGVLTEKSWRSADLRAVAEHSLAPHAAIGERIILDGPDLTLKPEAGVAVALAVHELATNACKYGALSNEAGVVKLSWRVSENDVFELRWEESGGPMVTPPARKGFGTNLIERSLRSYFKAKGGIEYHPEGLVFQLSGRLSNAVADSGE